MVKTAIYAFYLLTFIFLNGELGVVMIWGTFVAAAGTDLTEKEKIINYPFSKIFRCFFFLIYKDIRIFVLKCETPFSEIFL